MFGKCSYSPCTSLSRILFVRSTARFLSLWDASSRYIYYIYDEDSHTYASSSRFPSMSIWFLLFEFVINCLVQRPTQSRGLISFHSFVVRESSPVLVLWCEVPLDEARGRIADCSRYKILVNDGRLRIYLQVLIEVLINFHNRGLVSATIAIVRSWKYSHDIHDVGPIESLRQLQRSERSSIYPRYLLTSMTSWCARLITANPLRWLNCSEMSLPNV